MSKAKSNLTLNTDPKKIVSQYWLKSELLIFCRKVGLSTAGGKIDLTKRIENFLLTGEINLTKVSSKANKSKMPDHFSKDTIITEGFRCSQSLRAFFEKEIGDSFHFNEIMREFISKKRGLTLGDAIQAYQKSISNPSPRKIAPQFEYNQHIRDFFKENPRATLKEAIRAWKKNKALRRR